MANGLEKALFVVEKAAELMAGTPSGSEVGESTTDNCETRKSKEINEVGMRFSEGAHQDAFDDFDKFRNAEINLEGLAPTDAEKVRLVSEVISQIPEFQYDVWKDLSPEKRLSSLSILEQRVAALTLRPSCEVVMEEMDGKNGYQIGNKIALNKDLLESNNYGSMKQVIRTTLHEGRHAYQDYNLDTRIVEPNHELVNSWRVNLKDMGYENGKCGIFDFEKMGLKRYYTQPVEVDARVFAESVVGRVYA